MEQKQSGQVSYPSSEKEKKRPTAQLSGVQVMFAAILAIGLILGINFSTRLAASRPLEAYYKSVEEEIRRLELEQVTLIADRDYANSDAFVERWAREEWKMVRPGEVLIVPLVVGTPANSAPAPQFFVEVDTSPPKPDNWTLWWALFFDNDPPEF